MCLFCPKCGFFCPQTPEIAPSKEESFETNAFVSRKILAHGQRPRPLSHRCAMPAPPKWEPLAVHAKFISLPRPLPLGEVDLRSKDGEGEDAPHVQQKRAAAQRSVQRLSGEFSSSLPEPFSGSLRSGPGSWCCGNRTAYHPDGQWRPLPSCR